MTLTLLLALLLVSTSIDSLADALNVKSSGLQLPREFEGYYDPEKYQKSQMYLRETTRFHNIERLVFLVVTIAFIVFGGFQATDLFARSFHLGPVATGLIFVASLSILRGILQLPFSIYGTFVLEEKYGFNKTTVRTFILDLIKGIALGGLLGGGAFALLIYFFDSFPQWGWLYAWGGLTAFQIILLFLAPVLIMPLFFKFQPLPSGPLKEAVEAYAEKENFQLQGIFFSDASKRSTKSNAFFTGFGRFRKLVLFDTLIEKHSTEELVAVVAHEVGHFKLKHIIRSMLLSFFTSATLFFVFSRFLGNPSLFEAFQMTHVSTYASIIFISLFFSPITRFFSVFTHYLSRKYEFEADAFSLKTYAEPETLIRALKRLSVDNLSNLTPHRFKVLLDYTHPPVLERIRAIRESQHG